MKRVLSLFLASICAIMFCACKDKPAKDKNDDSSDPVVVVTRENALLYEGETEYTVVIPENAENGIVNAVSELNLFFKEATGVEFEVVTDNGLTLNENSKYISIGNTALLQEAGIQTDNDELFRSGYVIKSVGKSYFLTGRTEWLSYGNLYAVYDFLSQFVGYEYFAPGCYSLDRNVRSIATKELDIVAIPDIAQRALGYYNVMADTEWSQRLRLEKYNDPDTWITMGHSQITLVNPDVLGDLHPEWFSSDKETICLENAEMRAYLAEQLKQPINNAQDGIVVQLGQADNGSVCSCDACLTARETLYMNYAGQQIAFLNDISDRLEDWLAVNHPGREVLFTGFAYHYSEAAPCVYNEETGIYEPFSEYVIPKDNVGIYWAPIRNDYAVLINDPSSTLNETSYKAIQAWHDLMGDKNRIYMWSYCTNFRNYFLNFPNFQTLAENYKLYAENGVRYIFDQGPTNSGSAAFEELRAYLQANLMWDTSLNVNELVKRFIDNYYGVASEEMYDYYMKLNAYHSGLLRDSTGFNGTVYNSIGESKYWPIGVLNSFDEIFVSALEKVQSSNLSAEDKETYNDRIYRNYLTIKYLYMKNYRGNFTDGEINETIALFEKYREMYNLFNTQEGELLESVLQSWRA